MTDELDEIRQRYATAIERFGDCYEAYDPGGMPHLRIGHQSFPIGLYDEDRDPIMREWLGIMLCAALGRLVEERCTPCPVCAAKDRGVR